jgi:putative transposase
VVAWAAGSTIHREPVLNSLAAAVTQRRPHGAVIRSDLGVQLGSDALRRLCLSNRLEPTMSWKGSYWDNAVAESYFSSPKKERLKQRIYPSPDVAPENITDNIDMFYNRTPRHSYLLGVSPEQFEDTHKRSRRRKAL